jgi:RNA polymerase sigma-70 factor (ECF subfamily)
VDAITIERARRHDRGAQAQLLRHLQDPWFRLCRSFLRDDDLARDATQETALRFLRDLPRFRGDSSITTWSMGIAVNVVREIRRSRVTTETPHRRLLAASRADAPAPPDESAQRSEVDAILRATLDGLSDRQREAIVLRFFEELSIEETAQSMGCASGTVKATVHQALRILRDKLRQLS